MAIRPVSIADRPFVDGLAEERRAELRRHDPWLWADAAPAVHALDAVRTAPARVDAISLVAAASTHAGTIDVRPVDVSSRLGTIWLVEQLEARCDRVSAAQLVTPSRTDIERVLLAAAAAEASRCGGGDLVAGIPTTDHRRRHLLADSGFVLDSWFRHVDLTTPTRVQGESSATNPPALPLPHAHEFAADVARGDAVAVPGGHAVLSPSIVAGTTVRPHGRFSVVDPVLANDTAAMSRVVERVEDIARRRGDATLFVAVSPTETQLDFVLAARGYQRSIDWWLLPTTP